MPAIAELTEFVPLTEVSANFNGFPSKNDLGKKQKMGVFTPSNDTYKINPDIIKKAEDLLGKASLDNTDLTITSLNYIDEQQNTVNGSNDKALQNFFDKKSNNTIQKSTENENK